MDVYLALGEWTQAVIAASALIAALALWRRGLRITIQRQREEDDPPPDDD